MKTRNLIALIAAAVLPLTAWTAAPDTPALPEGVELGKGSIAFFPNDDVLINGKVKRLEQLTRAERVELRATILKSQRELARDRAALPGELAELRREADRARNGELKRELMRDREDLRRDLAEVDREYDEHRANGEDPEKMKAEIRESLRQAEAIDIDEEIREAIEADDPDKLLAELRADEEQMARLRARLDQLDRK